MTYSIIKKSQLEGALRLDAEYYQPIYLALQKKLLNNQLLKSLVQKIIHPKEIKRLYSDSGKTFLVSKNIKNNHIDLTDRQYINSETEGVLQNNRIVYGDLVTVRTGEVGNTSFWGKNYDSYVSADCILIKKPKISPIYLSTYLSSDPIRLLMKRNAYGIAQPHITPKQIGEIPVLVPNQLEQKIIENLVNESVQLKNTAINLLNEAENHLLSILNLKGSDLDNTKFSIINLSAIKLTDRMDAEYFEKKYEILLTKIKLAKNSKISSFILYNKRGVQPDYLDNLKYYALTSQFIKDKYIDYESLSGITEKQYKNNKNSQLKFGDIVTYTTGAYVGRTQIWLNKNKKTIASNHVNILRVENINPLYLGLVLNSLIGQMQIERIISGAAQAELYSKDIENFIVPILPKSTQQKIAELVQKSHTARQKSKELLEEAKHKVEELIEKSN